MAKQIAGFSEPKSKPLAPIFSYEIDTGKGKPLVIEANRVDQIGDAITFMIEYNDYTVYVAGFSGWKSYCLIKSKETLPPSKDEEAVEETPQKKPKKTAQMEENGDLFEMFPRKGKLKN
jgi:hypothetical protein